MEKKISKWTKAFYVFDSVVTISLIISSVLCAWYDNYAEAAWTAVLATWGINRGRDLINKQ